MPWSATYDAKRGIVETIYDGIVTPPELEAAVRATIQLLLDNATLLILGDCRTLTGGHSPSDLFGVGELVQELLPGRFPREAVLLPELPAAQAEARFWESTATNRGMIVRLFTDREAALAWLLVPDPRLN